MVPILILTFVRVNTNNDVIGTFFSVPNMADNISLIIVISLSDDSKISSFLNLYIFFEKGTKFKSF